MAGVLKKRLSGIFIAFLTLLFSMEASAFDGKRSGIQMSFGAGIHGGSFEDYDSSFVPNSGQAGGLASSFKFGIGFTNQFSLYYIRNVSWFRLQSGENDPFIFLAGISGVGATYFFRQSGSSFYVMGAAGVGDYGTPFNNNITIRNGSSALLGIGYEFTPRHMLELSGLFIELGRDFENRFDASSSLQLTYNYMFY